MLNKHIQKITKALFFLGSLLFLSILLLTIANIVLRAMGSNLRGAVELSGFLGAAALGLCLPHVQMQKAHANAGVFYTRLGAIPKACLHVFVSFLCLGITVVCTRELLDVTLFTYEGMEVVDGFNIPAAYFLGALTLGCAGQCLVLALECLQILQKAGQILTHVFTQTKGTAPIYTFFEHSNEN